MNSFSIRERIIELSQVEIEFAKQKTNKKSL